METFFAIIGCAGVGFALGVAILWLIGLVDDVRILQEGSGDKARDFDLQTLAKRVEKLETVITGHAHRISAESTYSKLLSDTLAKVTDRVEKLES